MTFKEQIELYLDKLPSEWKEKITDLLCEMHTNIECEDIKECETVTNLSDFTLFGSTVSIQYTDENEVTYTRSFDVEQLLSNELNDLDAKCLTSQSEWDNMTYKRRIQLLIDSHCACCGETPE